MITLSCKTSTDSNSRESSSEFLYGCMLLYTIFMLHSALLYTRPVIQMTIDHITSTIIFGFPNISTWPGLLNSGWNGRGGSDRGTRGRGGGPGRRSRGLGDGSLQALENRWRGVVDERNNQHVRVSTFNI